MSGGTLRVGGRVRVGVDGNTGSISMTGYRGWGIEKKLSVASLLLREVVMCVFILFH